MRPSSETELRQSLADIATPQILVVGDLMLDRAIPGARSIGSHRKHRFRFYKLRKTIKDLEVPAT